ncbi:retrovirus-related pol polyprotein from transposon TNT 1-94 [Tanacetum coccineum]
MLTQQDIYAAGSENRPPILNKDNYVPWYSRLLREVPIAETFHEQTDEELTKKEVKQREVDDQAIHTILMGLPEDIYAIVDSCETAKEIWLHVQQMMKGSDIGIQEKKAKLFNEWERFTSTDGESIESYYHCFSKLHNQNVGNQNGYNVIQNVKKQVVQNVVQNSGIQNVRNHNGLIVVLGIANPNANHNRNGNVIATRAGGIQLQAEKFDFMATARDLEEIGEVNANCRSAKFLGTVRFGNDHIAAMLGYSDLQLGNILITRVYFIEGLGHNLFSVVVKEYFDSVGISHQASSVRTPQQNGVVERRNRTLVEAARTMLIFSRSSLFLWAKAIATSCYTQNRSIIHRRFKKTPYELINGRKPNISFLHVFGALYYPKNDCEDIGKLDENGDIRFFISYSANSCTYRIYNRRTKKIMETMNVTFDELSAMVFEQSSSKPGLQGMTSGQISSGLDLTYAPSTITSQKPTESELDLLFEAMYDDYIGGQPLDATRTALAAQAPQVLQTLMTSTTTANTTLMPTNSSS